MVCWISCGASVEEFRPAYDLDDQRNVAALRMQLLSCTNSIRAFEAREETRECDRGIGESMLARCGVQLLISLGVDAFWFLSRGSSAQVREDQSDINARAAMTLFRAPTGK